MINRIKQYRLQAGLTPQAVSAMFKIPYNTIIKWEKEELTPPPWAEEMVVNALRKKSKAENDRAKSRFKLPYIRSDKTPEEIAAANAARRWINPTRRCPLPEVKPPTQRIMPLTPRAVPSTLPKPPGHQFDLPAPREKKDTSAILEAAKAAAEDYDG